MKLRYVFTLMLAAAVAGSAATYFVSEFNRDFAAYVERGLRMQKKESVQNPTDSYKTFEQNYRHIADAIGSRCRLEYDPYHPGVSEVFTDFTHDVERGWIQETQKLRDDKEVSRVGPRLRIKAKARDVEFLDVGYLCHDVDVQIHRYKGKLPKIGWHAIEVVPYEGGYDSIIVSPETGETIRTFETLLESPSGARLVASFSEEAAAGGFQIFRMNGNKLVSELQSSVGQGVRHPIFELDYILEVIGWIDDESMLLLMSQNRQAKLIHRDGKWQLEYLSQ